VNAQQPDLATALADAARAINAHRTLEETLEAIVGSARTSVPGFDHVGISVIRCDGTVETKAATGPLVWELDDLQYELGEGPCVTSIREEPVVVVEHLRDDPRWPNYIPRAVKSGLRAQLALQLYTEEQTLGGLNLYSTSSDTIDADAHRAAEPFAAHAALALGHARRESQLSEALESRAMIATAVGLVMARYQIDQTRAFQYLARASSASKIKLRDVAAEVVSNAEQAYGHTEPASQD
jgi:GAF domain-containing protein